MAWPLVHPTKSATTWAVKMISFISVLHSEFRIFFRWSNPKEDANLSFIQNKENRAEWRVAHTNFVYVDPPLWAGHFKDKNAFQ